MMSSSPDPNTPEASHAPDAPETSQSPEDPSSRAREASRPLIFGEALFDHFPDGSRVLGGAPFNVAWHLRGFKAHPLLVSAVGQDEAGEEILERMEEWGMDRQGVQRHPELPTGKVQAQLRDGDVRYRIQEHQAYDAIRKKALPTSPVLDRTDLLYHGTLALREATNRETLGHLRDTLPCPILLDVNLREPWWTREGVNRLLEEADWVKMNREEASLLSGRTIDEREDLLRAARDLQSRHGIRNLVVTLGEEGALGLDAREAVWQEAPEVRDAVDTVGAGDAFSAVMVLGIQQAWALADTLRRAAEFAAELCRFRGAIPDEPHLYSGHLRRWQDGV